MSHNLKISNPLITSFLDLILYPRKFYQFSQHKIKIGLIAIFLLILTTFFQKCLFLWRSESSIKVSEILINSILNSILTWAAFSVFFFAIVSTFRVKVDFWQMTGAIGACSLPLSAANLISILLLLLFYSSETQMIHNVITWIGMAAGWPGIHCYLANTEFGGMPKRWAAVISAGVFILLFAGYWLTG